MINFMKEIDTSKELKLENLTIYPIDKDGEFEIVIDDYNAGDIFKYLDKEKAKLLAEYILKSINNA